MLEEKAIEEMLLLTMFSLRMENVRVNEPSHSRMFLFIFLVPFRYNFLLGAFFAQVRILLLLNHQRRVIEMRED